MTLPWGLLSPEEQMQHLQGAALQAGPTPPMPFAPKTSILDRVVNRLFPTGQYTGLLDPGAQRSVQQQGLLGLGAGLLQAGAPHPYQAGTLGNLGAALQQNQMNFPQMAQQALQLESFRSQSQRAAAAVQAASHESDPLTMIQRIMPLFADDPKSLEALGAAAKSLGGEARNLQEVKGIVDNRLGVATTGQRGTALVDPRGRIVQFYPEGQEPVKPDAVLPFAKDFESAIAPHTLAKQSYDTYQSTTDQGPIADQTRLAAAINVVLPGSHVTPAQLSDPATAADFKGVPLIGPIIGALDPKTHTLPAAERKALDSIVANAARLRRQESATITQQKLGLAPPGINARLYARDPWNPLAAPTKRPKLQF